MRIEEADVVIIGGGISGCATAYNLAKRGSKVVLLEKGEIASEGSGRTSAAVRLQGRDPAEIPLMQECIKIWERLSEELRTDVEFVRGGNLYVAETKDQLEELEKATKDSQAQGLPTRIITAEEARKIVPALEGPFLAAMYSPIDGHANPVKTTTSFANAAKEYGARVYTQTTALGIGVKGGEVSSVLTTRGEIKTPVVVNAAGVWAHRVAGLVGVPLPIKVVRLSVMETEPCPPLTKTFIRTPAFGCRQMANGCLRLGGGYRIPVDHDFGLDAFEDLGLWLPRFRRFMAKVKIHPDGGVFKHDLVRISGGRVEFPIVEPKANYKTLEENKKAIRRLMPSIADVKVAKMLAGLIDLSPDMIPVIGHVERHKGFIVAAGFSGHGFALGPITGRLVSELILDGKPSISLNEFSHSRLLTGRVRMPEKLI